MCWDVQDALAHQEEAIEQALAKDPLAGRHEIIAQVRDHAETRIPEECLLPTRGQELARLGTWLQVVKHRTICERSGLLCAHTGDAQGHQAEQSACNVICGHEAICQRLATGKPHRAEVSTAVCLTLCQT